MMSVRILDIFLYPSLLLRPNTKNSQKMRALSICKMEIYIFDKTKLIDTQHNSKT